MNGTLASCQQLANGLRGRLGSHRTAEIVVFPPSPCLVPVYAKLAGSAVQVGAQDVHPLPSGAFTSGVSADLVQSIGCGWALVGHSERRSAFGDSDARVGDKLAAALTSGLKPILCVGESLEERQGGRTFAVLGRQLDVALRGHEPAALANLVLAYEPVWAIGTGVTATPEQAGETHAWIRRHMASRLGSDFAHALRIQYGGSVKPSNVSELIACPDIDGALVGGASLQVQSFTRIVQLASNRAHAHTGRGAA
jgi:triosephosphate isomerase